MQRTLLALALIATAGTTYAQTMSTAVDANGRPIIGRNDWVRQPGDGPGPNAGLSYSANPNLATAPNSGSWSGRSEMGTPLEKGGKLSTQHATGPEPMPPDRGPHQTAFRDEYGFRYDADGNRLDGRGNVMSPHIPSR